MQKADWLGPSDNLSCGLLTCPLGWTLVDSRRSIPAEFPLLGEGSDEGGDGGVREMKDVKIHLVYSSVFAT